MLKDALILDADFIVLVGIGNCDHIVLEHFENAGDFSSRF